MSTLFDNVEVPLLIEGATRELGLVRIDHGWGAQDIGPSKGPAEGTAAA